MKKPVWLRLMGWSALALAALQVWLFYEVGLDPTPLGPRIASEMVLFAGTILLVVWALVSAFLWFSRRNALENALAMSQAARRVGSPPQAGAESVAGRFHHTVRRPAEAVTPTPLASPRPVMTSPLALSTLHPPPSSDPPPDPYALIRGEACDTCGRDDVAPRFHCCRHETTVCFLCLVAHDARQECYYIPAGRAPRREPARVAVGAGRRDGALR